METKHHSIIEDPLFFKWVYKPDASTELYWEQYMEENPEDLDFILETKSNLKKLSHSYERLSEQERKSLSFKIREQLDLEDHKIRRINFAKAFLRYAAVAILFSAISGIVVFLKMNNPVIDTYEKYSVAPVQVQEPILILSEKNTVDLKKSKSTVEYSETGKIILNDEKVLVTAQNKGVKQSINQLVIPFGNRSKATLSDGTVVWLNAGSRLVYPSQFTGETREVSLYGEAFFEVTHNEDMPFIVKTSAIDIKVLGTQFNVSAYSDNNIIQTVLEEGSIAIRRKGNHLFERDLILKPNQMNVFNLQTEESKVYLVEARDYSLWREGLLKFDEMKLEVILKKVERYYNIQITTEKPAIENLKVSGKLDLNQDIIEVLEYLGKVSRKKFVRINNSEYIMK